MFRISTVRLEVEQPYLVRLRVFWIRVVFGAKLRKNRRFLESVDAQDLEDFAHARRAVRFLLEDCHEDVDAQRNPYLSLDRVVGVAQKGFDPQILLDPLEKQLDLPATAIELRDRQRGQLEVVGQKDEALSTLEGDVADASQGFGVLFRHLRPLQGNRLVASEARDLVNFSGFRSRGV